MSKERAWDELYDGFRHFCFTLVPVYMLNNLECLNYIYPSVRLHRKSNEGYFPKHQTVPLNLKECHQCINLKLELKKDTDCLIRNRISCFCHYKECVIFILVVYTHYTWQGLNDCVGVYCWRHQTVISDEKGCHGESFFFLLFKHLMKYKAYI